MNLRFVIFVKQSFLALSEVCGVKLWVHAHLFLQPLLLLHQLLHLLHRLLEIKLQHGALLLYLHHPALRSHPQRVLF